MLEITVFNTVSFALVFLGLFYLGICAISQQIIVPKYKKLFFYITIFSLLGITGEVAVNTLYSYVFNTPLWEYRLFPAHHKDVSYFFIFIWGSLGFYKYITDQVFAYQKRYSETVAGLVMGAEAIILELLYNGIYFLFFNDYIFYYFPNNLGPFSHLSCLQVIPFYFMVGLVVTKLIRRQEVAGYHKSIFIFYWMIIITFILST